MVLSQFFRIRAKYLQFIDRNQIYGISLNIYADKIICLLFLSGNLNECTATTPIITDAAYKAGLNQLLASQRIEPLDLMLADLSIQISKGSQQTGLHMLSIILLTLSTQNILRTGAISSSFSAALGTGFNKFENGLLKQHLPLQIREIIHLKYYSLQAD